MQLKRGTNFLANGDEMTSYSRTRQIPTHSLRIGAWTSFVLAWCLGTTALAATTDGLPAAPEKVVLVRGQDSIVQELNIGPEATTLWREIQKFVASGADITEFSKLVAQFQLRVQNPINEIGPTESQPHFRRDFSGWSGMISGGEYGVGVSSDAGVKKFVTFSIELDNSKICISESEVKRVYGYTFPSLPTHLSYAHAKDPTGVPHGLGYKVASSPNAGFGFNINKSGCVKSFGTTADI